MSTCNTCMNKKYKDIFYDLLLYKGAISPLDLKNNPCCYCKNLFENDLYEAELKRCPFCGSTAHIQSTTWGDTDRESYSAICDNPKCEMETGWFDTKKEAIEFWNRRV